MRVLSDADVAAVLDLDALLPVVEEAFAAQGRGAVERPERPHYRVGTGREGGPHGTALAMPAYVHGTAHYATKLASVHPDNPARDLPTVQAQVALHEAETGRPVALLAGTRITNARTACVGGLAARELGGSDVAVGLLGAGAQARWQVRAIDATAGVGSVRVYSPTTREACAAALREEGFEARAVGAPREAVAGADVVVTATTASEPVFPPDALAPGALVVAVGAYTADTQELAPGVFERAARQFADVPEEVAETGDALAAGLDGSDFVALSEVLAGRAGREGPGEVLVVESVGSAVLDAAAAAHLLERAREAGRGTTVSLGE
jgi:alanine dehydrogenase